MWLCAFGAVCSAGCGGGQSGSAVSAASHTSTLGNATVTYYGQPKPQFSSSSQQVTVLGQAGATFSNVTLEPPASLADTYIVYSRDSGLYILPDAYASPKLLYQNPVGAVQPGISTYGTVAFCNDYQSQAYTIHPDGTGLKNLPLSGVSAVYFPQYALDGTNRIAFTDNDGDVYVAPGAGGTATKIQMNCYDNAGVYWNPAGTEIVYAVPTSEGSDMYETSPSGGAATDITPTSLRNSGTMYPMAWSADGVTVLMVYRPSGASTNELVKFNATNAAYYQIVTPSGDDDGDGTFSPDGDTILLVRAGANGATPGLYTSDANGLGQALLYPDSSAGGFPVNNGVAWSPFLPKETVVAASASTFYHQAASGFLLSQSGSQFGSMVAFTANTPADAAIQAPATSTGYAPMAFTITADSITSIGYVNNYFDAGTTVTLTSTPSVVVTIDATTGQVDLVAPAATPKASPTKNADGTLTYKASFKAVYDGKGRNLAPNGASSLTVDPKSGKLVRFA